jgi:K+-transporting ATPase ATPase C chain
MSSFAPALRLTLTMTALTGLAWPLLLTGVAQALLPGPAGGSVVRVDGAPVGSALVGQAWTSDRYLAGRPSAIAVPYDAATSSGSNLGPTNPALHEAIQERVRALRAAHVGQTAPVPLDLVTASASGLDPHLTPAGAAWQAPRIAAARGLPVSKVQEVIDAHTAGRLLGVFGEPRVDVLATNLALDALVGR